MDYLQLVRPATAKDSRVNEVSEITQGMKAIAKELDREMNRHFTAVNASLPKPNPNADPAYKPYDPDAPETTSHAEAPTAKKSDDPVTKKPDDKAAKKLERQKRREARKKVRDR